MDILYGVGEAGLRVGDELLPLDKLGYGSKMHDALKAALRERLALRTDVIPITTNVDYAYQMAGLALFGDAHWGAGVYRIEVPKLCLVIGNPEHDPLAYVHHATVMKVVSGIRVGVSRAPFLRKVETRI